MNRKYKILKESNKYDEYTKILEYCIFLDLNSKILKSRQYEKIILQYFDDNNIKYNKGAVDYPEYIKVKKFSLKEVIKNYRNSIIHCSEDLNFEIKNKKCYYKIINKNCELNLESKTLLKIFEIYEELGGINYGNY